MSGLSPKKKFTYQIVALIFGLVIGGFLGYWLKPAPSNPPVEDLRENSKTYHFINPLLAVDQGDTKKTTPQSVALYNQVQTFINQQVANSSISTASVYFIDYGKSDAFSINEDDTYNPASLLKVATMIAYLRDSEDDPTLLNQQLTFSADMANSLKNVPFEPPSELVAGSSYAVSYLIDKMIADSDNGALDLLTSHMSPADLQQVYTDLGLKSPENSYPAPYTISIKDYSLFFRVLYNATYLSKADSEKALSILSEATFKDGLEKGIPPGTQIAHKFGEYITGQDGTPNSIELHDCGIVYTGKNTYFLCVMTKGNSYDGVSSTIGGISKIVYDALDTNQ